MTRYLLLTVLSLLLAGCASLQGEYDPPKISVERFHAIPGSGGAPRFEVALRVLNPNKEALDIAGISYDIGIQGVDLVSGVTNEVPRIEGYGEQVITLEAGLNMLQLVRFLAGIGIGQEDLQHLEYQFKAKIDFKGFMPTQRIEETGVIGPPQRSS